MLRLYFDDGCASAFLDRMLNVDCRTRLTENQLPIVDRMSMAHSLELRSPVSRSPRCGVRDAHTRGNLKIKRGRIKHVTRELASRYLPRSIVNRPKKGFGFPLALWLRGPLRTDAADHDRP
jgi:asparagine synthase (glutamine-hydrolysing)